MAEQQLGNDRDLESLEELLATPVGRRWLLKAGLSTAAAATLVGRASASARPRHHHKPKHHKKKKAPGTRLQFALKHAKGVSGLVVVANGKRLALVKHTKASRAALKAEGGIWPKMDLAVLTHHVSGVPVHVERGMVVSVYGRRPRRGHRPRHGAKPRHRRRHTKQVLVSQMWHVPADATESLARTAHRVGGSLGSVAGSPRRLKSLGLTTAHVTTPEEVRQLSNIMDTYSTAAALVAFHPNVSTVNKTALAATNSLLSQTPAVQTLGTYITKMQQQGRDYATLVQATDPDGSPSQIKVGDQITTFSTTVLNSSDQTFVDAHVSALKAGIAGVRDSATLGAVIDKPLEQDRAASTKTWIQPQGIVPQPTPYSPTLATGAGLDIQVKNDGFWYGTRTKVTGGYQNGKVPLTLYNNFVRWIWVYVQYLGKDDANLSANPNAVWPDTKHAQSLGMLPQVFTILGIPVWDTNSIDVTLNYPQGAHTARLLYCGLGCDAVGAGWRQYFASDAYPGGIAPTDEVLVPSMITGIMTIGLTAFAFATDLDIATTWATIRKAVRDGVENKSVIKELTALATRAVNLTKAELAATAVASGVATYEDVKANGGPANLWNILLSLASVIPKFIFAPRQGSQLLGSVAGAVLASEAGSKIVAALPIIGQVLAAAEAVGDAITLAEVCTETIIAPWVIENEVSLTYKATVTISRDPCAATFPATARSFQLQPKVDGSVVLDPITGKINQGGKVQSDPLVLQVVAPFGGNQIQWSVVFLDDAGQQVGTGVSAQFVNDDPMNVPSTVGFAIKQLPATITGSTVFKRAATTAYSTADHGYTWSDQVAVTSTGGGIQDVTGAAVATTLGVAGMVWKQNDRFFLRGVPVAQNGATIELATPRKEGYARRPFLLLDSFVDVTKCDTNTAAAGNHVLLEPDETTDAYDVRRVTLDTSNGKLGWDPTASLGRFLLPVSAAALHSSGRVVAIHTDSGRVGAIEPLSAPLAVGGNGPGTTRLASYTGGPGTQVGLLSSPIAVAVTHPGTVLILEAAGPQLSAFDLNGNPVQYFGSAPNRQFTLPLSAQRTYLDVAVDGASQIYLLYHNGDGSDPQDYHLDVYQADGTPLVTKSAGVNVPQLAVDYWRSVFAPNYQPLRDLGTTTPHVDPALGVAEPSLSRFDPTNS
jgi:hypothetical protein